MLTIKIHTSYRNVVALADLDLVGKKFEQDKRQLDIRENFYKDKEISQEEAIQLLQSQADQDATFNIVGPKAIETAKQAGVISEANTATVDNIPFALKLA